MFRSFWRDPQRIVEIIFSIVHLSSAVQTSSLPRFSQGGDQSLERRQSGNPDPTNFIRRALHGSTVVGDTLYIDGGEISQYINGNNDTKTARVNNHTLAISLTTSWTNTSVQLRALEKNGAPSLNYPSLWSDGSSAFYLFGGELSKGANSSAGTPDVALWKFTAQPSGNGAWEQQPKTDPQVFNQLTRPSRAFVATGGTTGYVLGGYSFVRTDPDPSFGKNRVPVPGIVSFNWQTGKWSNRSADAFTDYGTAVSGQMQYVPTFGKGGLLLMFGGNKTTPTSWDKKASQLRFDNITIYEPDTGSWYSQTTTGDTPPVRELFCAVGARGENGTYEICVMGGWDDYKRKCYDDIYILSLPGFHWFKTNSIANGPRAFHTCNVIGNRQMVVIGGYKFVGKASKDWGDPDPWRQGIGIFDMTDLRWSSGYDADAATYQSPEQVKNWYNKGNGNDVSWTNAKVRALFATTNENNGSSEGGGAIVGGVVGGVLALALIAGVAWLLLRRRRSAAGAAAVCGSTVKDSNTTGGGYAYELGVTNEGLFEAYGQTVQQERMRASELPAGNHPVVNELEGTPQSRYT